MGAMALRMLLLLLVAALSRAQTRGGELGVGKETVSEGRGGGAIG